MSRMFRHMQEIADMAQRVYRRREVEAATGLSRSTIYAMMSRGEFPRPVKLTGKAVGWTEAAIADWLNSREQAAA